MVDMPITGALSVKPFSRMQTKISEAMRDGDKEGVFEAVRGDGNKCFGR
jgi:hypothetical protein